MVSKLNPLHRMTNYIVLNRLCGIRVILNLSFLAVADMDVIFSTYFNIYSGALLRGRYLSQKMRVMECNSKYVLVHTTFISVLQGMFCIVLTFMTLNGVILLKKEIQQYDMFIILYFRVSFVKLCLCQHVETSASPLSSFS